MLLCFLSTLTLSWHWRSAHGSCELSGATANPASEHVHMQSIPPSDNIRVSKMKQVTSREELLETFGFPPCNAHLCGHSEAAAVALMSGQGLQQCAGDQHQPSADCLVHTHCAWPRTSPGPMWSSHGHKTYSLCFPWLSVQKSEVI